MSRGVIATAEGRRPRVIDPEPGRDDGWRSDMDVDFYQRYFRTRGLMVERQLVVPLGLPALPFYLQQLAWYQGWVGWLAVESRVVNATVLREMVASTVQDPVAARVYHAYVRGQAVVVSAATISEAIGVAVEQDPFYPSSSAALPGGLTWDEICRRVTGGRVRAMPPEGRVVARDLTGDYNMLWLAIAACVQPTTYTAGLTRDQLRLVFGIGRGRSVCLPSILLDLFERSRSPASGAYIKAAGVLHVLAERAGVDMERVGDEVARPGESSFSMSADTRSAGQRGRPRAAGEDQAAAERPAQRQRVDAGGLADVRHLLGEVLEQVGSLRQEVTRIGRQVDRLDRRVGRIDRRVRVLGPQVVWMAGVVRRTDRMMERASHRAGLQIPSPVADPVFEEDPVSEGDQDEAGPSQVDPMAASSSRAGQRGRGPLPMPPPSPGHPDLDL